MRSNRLLLIILSVFIMMSSCSGDDDSGNGNQPANISFRPISIQFVNENGTIISTNCLDVNENYAVQIEVERVGTDAIVATQIQYTLNGVLYSMTFNQVGVQRQTIELVDGQNMAQLTLTGDTDEIRFVIQDDFELVL